MKRAFTLFREVQSEKKGFTLFQEVKCEIKMLRVRDREFFNDSGETRFLTKLFCKSQKNLEIDDLLFELCDTQKVQ